MQVIQANSLQPKLGLRAASFLVISVIIGSGVFKKIAPMAQELGTPWLILLCWFIAGIVSLAGALCTAELVSMYPNSGGEYNYFQKIYGRFFLFFMDGLVSQSLKLLQLVPWPIFLRSL